MYITKRGKYPENNKIECNECHCHFKYYDSEVKIYVTEPELSECLGGIGITRYIECPQCKTNVTISSEFYEDTSMVLEAIKNFINNIKNIFKKKGKDENGEIKNK